MVDSNKKAYPGMFLGYAYDFTIGDSGVYKKDDKLFASMIGEVCLDKNCSPPRIYIKNEITEYMPKIGDEVFSKITKVTRYHSTCEIVAFKSKPLKNTIMAMIKYENVKNDFREFDMFECFVPGDVVLAKVISIDQSNFIYLSTADVNYGVIFARSSITKNIMMPVSFDKMLCVDTKIQETRKVAKPNII